MYEEEQTVKRLLAVATALVFATAAYAAKDNAGVTLYAVEDGSAIHSGDRLVPRADGRVDLYRDGALAARLHDPEGLVSANMDVTAPLYITDAEGNAVHRLRGNAQDLFLSHDAPQIVYLRKDVARPQASGTVDMTWHGGTVLTANKTKAIFWGSWSSPGDIISGVDSFFAGWGGSGMAGDSTEYTGSNGQVTASSTYLGHVIDSSTPPRRALTVSGAVAEACSITGNNPDPNAVYFIYTSTGAGHVSYCAWHSWGNCSNGVPIQVAYMPNITGIAGCNPSSTVAGQSEGLAALANVTSHELSEAITDPRGAGWFDSSNGENGDKCGWSFHNNVTLSNGSIWKLQMEWSNRAYDAGTGYANSSGQKGCLQ
jgi:hypothetical protein